MAAAAAPLLRSLLDSAGRVGELGVMRSAVTSVLTLLQSAEAARRRHCALPAALQRLVPDACSTHSAPTQLLLLLPLLLLAARADELGDSLVLALALLALALSSERLYVASEAFAGHCAGVWRAAVYAVFANGSLVLYVSVALHHRALRLAQLALLGSVLVNTLAVPGGALLALGLRTRTARFSASQARAYAALLVLAACAMFVPTMLAGTGGGDGCAPGAVGADGCGAVLAVSRALAFLLLLLYGAWLRFAYGTHAQLFVEEPAPARAGGASMWGDAAACAQLSPRAALAASVLVGMLCAALCFLVIEILDGDQVMQHNLGASHAFWAAIALPVALNAGEFASALMHAQRGAGTAALGVPLRAATQVALCVLPTALLGAALRGLPLDMNVRVFEGAALLLSVLTAALTLADGSADWLKGVILLSVFLVVAAAFAASTEHGGA